ncbi:MAG: glycine zipper family protein [Thermodesulfobacteriota bacterium]
MDKDTDRCHIWAVDQTKFDPTASYTPSSSGPRQPTPRSGVLAGAVKGTILGAVVGAIRGDIGRDIAIGASSGAILGAFNKYDERKNRKYYQKQYEEQQKSEFVAKKTNYNRAYTVCLTGRGYTVK